MRSRNSVVLSLLIFAGLAASATAQVKLESAGPLKGAALSAEIRKAVQTQGERVLLGNGETQCELWLAASLPAPPAQDTEHTNYSGKLTPGEFVGVVRFPRGARDFRGQAIKPGTYTLRYELMPNDGNHMGVAPQRDFLLLTPPGEDAKTTTITTAELLKASRAASGTPHPAVFLLLPAGEVAKPPSLSPAGGKGGTSESGAAAYENPDGYLVFVGRAGTVPLALVVKGEEE